MDTITSADHLITDHLTTTEVNKFSPEQIRENYLEYHRKAYDKRRDKVVAHKKACYEPPDDP
jgi:hypothetical protein